MWPLIMFESNLTYEVSLLTIKNWTTTDVLSMRTHKGFGFGD